jgi:hypothetical protein
MNPVKRTTKRQAVRKKKGSHSCDIAELKDQLRAGWRKRCPTKWQYVLVSLLWAFLTFLTLRGQGALQGLVIVAEFIR